MALISSAPTPGSWLAWRDLAWRVISNSFTTIWQTSVVGCTGKADPLIPVVLMIVGGKSFTANLLRLFRVVRSQPRVVPFLVSDDSTTLPGKGRKRGRSHFCTSAGYHGSFSLTRLGKTVRKSVLGFDWNVAGLGHSLEWKIRDLLKFACHQIQSVANRICEYWNRISSLVEPEALKAIPPISEHFNK